MLDFIAPYWKAVVAFLAPAAVALTAAVQADSAGGDAITTAEWIAAVCACFITSAAVYAVPNRARAEAAEDGTEPTEVEAEGEAAGE